MPALVAGIHAIRRLQSYRIYRPKHFGVAESVDHLPPSSAFERLRDASHAESNIGRCEAGPKRSSRN
jgi:hypothetical protein